MLIESTASSRNNSTHGYSHTILCQFMAGHPKSQQQQQQQQQQTATANNFKYIFQAFY